MLVQTWYYHRGQLGPKCSAPIPKFHAHAHRRDTEALWAGLTWHWVKSVVRAGCVPWPPAGPCHPPASPSPSLTSLFWMWKVCWKLLTVAEPGSTAWRSAEPQATMLPRHRGGQHPSDPRRQPPHPPPRHPPVVGAVGAADGGVGAVRDEPLAGFVGAQADGGPLCLGHVGAVGIEVAQEEDVLRGSAALSPPEAAPGGTGGPGARSAQILCLR